MKQEGKKCNKQIFSLSYWADICNLTAAKSLGFRLLPGGIWYNSELKIKTWTEEGIEGWTTNLRAAGSTGKWWGELGCGACKWRRQIKSTRPIWVMDFIAVNFTRVSPGESASGLCCLGGKSDRYVRMSLTRSGFELFYKGLLGFRKGARRARKNPY